MARFSGSGGGEGTPGPEGPAGPPGADGADANTGDITFDGIQIIGAGTASGDGGGYGTMQLVPDGDLTSDQYLIIDPTAPNHIHIRAGGTQDESSSDLFLGGERNNLRISDGGRDVAINARPAPVINSYTNENPTSNTNFIISNTANIYVGDTAYAPGGDTVTIDSVTQDSPSAGLQTVTGNLNGTPAQFVGGAAHTFIHEESWNHSWLFNDDGYLTGPAMGGLFVSGLLNGESDLWLSSNDNVVLNGNDGGEFLNDASNPANQIATIGDLDNTVSNGMVRYTPAFTATGLAFTGSGATHPTYNSYYVKSGSMVSFVIEVNLSTVTNFGTGQYKLQLPFTPAVGYNHFPGWANVDPALNPDVPDGHFILNVDHTGLTDVLDLHYLKQAGGANSGIIEGLFLQGTPVTLSTSSKIYINGTYIADTAP